MQFVEHYPILYPNIIGDKLIYEIATDNGLKTVAHKLPIPEQGKTWECFGVKHSNDYTEYTLIVDTL